MKFAAAYLLACLGAEQAALAAAAATEEGAVFPAPAAAPTKDDVRRILGAVGADADEARLDLLFALMDGKDVAELVAAGREQLAYAPSGAALVAAGPAAGGAAGDGKEEAADKEEKKKEEEEVEEEDVNMFSLFDD